MIWLLYLLGDPMATSELQTFVEGRLAALVPGIDLSPGSPAEVQFVNPLIAYLGTDPFETDIESYLTDRFAQEFPDVYASNAGAVRDTYIKPLILMLEPFKRETQAISKNQSFKDPTVLSDDDADALAANYFATRNSGGFAHGVARVYYPNPATVSVDLSNRFYTASGLGFYAVTPLTVSAEEMAFNRDGLFYFVDISVRAEAAGDGYNIDVNSLVGVDGLFGYVKIDNLKRFEDGASSVDTPTFIAATRQSLAEQSLVSRRGATARINNDFQGDVQAIQVIGANDPEMQRDILVADAPGQMWATGQVLLFPATAVVLLSVFDDPGLTPTPDAGDYLYIYLDKYSWPSLPQSKRFVRLLIDSVVIPSFTINDDVSSLGCLVQWSDPDGNLPPGIDIPVEASGGFLRIGTIHVSSLPDIGSVDLIVADQTVHVYGHSDVYVRPVLQNTSTAVLSNLADDPRQQDFKVQSSNLQITEVSNWVRDITQNFVLLGVEPGDLLTIETGNNIGTYVIGYVVPYNLYLTSDLVATDSNVRYRITKTLTVNPFEPKIPKLPFGTVGSAAACNDLHTVIGSNVFEFLGSGTDLLAYGVKIGDTVRVASNVDAGDFTITGFNSNKNVVVDRPAAGTNSDLEYKIFTKLNPVVTPLVRIKSLELLDSSQTPTGLTIPYAKPLAVVPTSDFTSAQVRGSSQWKSGFVLPNLTGLVVGDSRAATTGDRRYSMRFDPTEGGIFRAMISGPAGSQVQAELLFPGDAFTSCSYFVAVCEDTSHSENFPPVDPKEGDALTLLSGPNAGSYNIASVRKFKYQTQNVVGGVPTIAWIYFIKILGTFPVDPFSEILDILGQSGIYFNPDGSIINNGTASPIAFPDFFVNVYNTLPEYLMEAINAWGASLTDVGAMATAIASICMSNYEWGDPARGVLRSYFYAPTLFRQNTAVSPDPTTYAFTNADGITVRFRPDPDWYNNHELIPGRLTSDADPLDYPRDMIPGGPDESTPNPSDARFTSSPTVFAEGVRVGDVLSVHEEVLFHGSTGWYSPSPTTAPWNCDRMTAVGTVAGSSKITALPSASGSVFAPVTVGDLLFIDEGTDLGSYKVTEVVDAWNLVLDRPLTRSTPKVIMSGHGATWILEGGSNKIQTPTPVGFSSTLVGNYVTLYGIDSRYQGSYRISDVPDSSTLVVDRAGGGLSGDFPVTSDGLARWVVTLPPPTIPALNPSGKGTVLWGLQPVRVYDGTPENYSISNVDLSAEDSDVVVTGSIEGGINQPYRIYRPNIRRVTPTEMAQNQDGAYFFFDTQVVSLGPEDANNIPKGTSYLVPDEGTYESEGYTQEVDDKTLTYSMKETGVLKIPTRILPQNVPDVPSSYVNLVGVPVEITYEAAGIVQQIQTFLDSPDDRVTVANMLARHFLPAYVSYDAAYTGGSAPSVIAHDIIDYINNLPIETPIDVSEIEKLVDNRGGNPVTPTKVFLNLHDWDRREWLEFSENEIGGMETYVPYDGTPRVSFYIPGPDMSGATTKPLGERVNLIQK